MQPLRRFKTSVTGIQFQLLNMTTYTWRRGRKVEEQFFVKHALGHQIIHHRSSLLRRIFRIKKINLSQAHNGAKYKSFLE